MTHLASLAGLFHKRRKGLHLLPKIKLTFSSFVRGGSDKTRRCVVLTREEEDPVPPEREGGFLGVMGVSSGTTHASWDKAGSSHQPRPCSLRACVSSARVSCTKVFYTKKCRQQTRLDDTTLPNDTRNAWTTGAVRPSRSLGYHK